MQMVERLFVKRHEAEAEQPLSEELDKKEESCLPTSGLGSPLQGASSSMAVGEEEKSDHVVGDAHSLLADSVTSHVKNQKGALNPPLI